MSRSPEKTAFKPNASNLTELEHDSWELLSQALDRKKDGGNTAGFRFMTLATCTPRGGDARTVVLRQVNTAHKYVWFYTDARTEKVLQLEAFPMATLLSWDSKSQVQLRLTIETRLHTNDFMADEHWEKVAPHERKLYLSEVVPGTELPEPYPGYPDHLSDKLPTKKDTEVARGHFAAIECRVLAMEYLHLSPQGQTRASFQYEPDSKMMWLAP